MRDFREIKIGDRLLFNYNRSTFITVRVEDTRWIDIGSGLASPGHLPPDGIRSAGINIAGEWYSCKWFPEVVEEVEDLAPCQDGQILPFIPTVKELAPPIPADGADRSSSGSVCEPSEPVSPGLIPSLAPMTGSTSSNLNRKSWLNWWLLVLGMLLWIGIDRDPLATLFGLIGGLWVPRFTKKGGDR